MSETDSPAVAEQAQTSAVPVSDKPPAERHARASGLPLAMALASLIVSIGLAVAAYFIWYQVQQLSRQQAVVEAGVSDRIQPLRASLDGVNRALRDERAAVDAKIRKVDEDQQSISHRISTLAAIIGRSESGWTLAEVEYLLRIGNQLLQLQRDTNAAAKALEAADERLREFADPHYLDVREQIARDLEAVKAVPEVDVDGLAVTLGAAITSVDRLPVAGTHYQPVSHLDKDNGVAAGTTAKNIDELGKVVWASLSELFRLREHDKPVGPMLPPEREYFLRENFRLQLAAARLALLRNDAAQYQAALHTATEWLVGYFDPADTSVQQLKSRLEAIAAVDIAPKLPDVSGALRLLRQQMRLSEQQEVLPVVPAKEATDSGAQPHTVDQPDSGGSSQ
ncbi:MAG: uroporphyrinogen-III C-methyltransferase [Thiogranum sp.]|jgi:uroporphyrin-3 C-methyltransferase|nr:uroporphyrinogen-III C-methyltransferase [Thiogranum sp.]